MLDSPFASRSGHKSFDLPLDALPAKPRAKDASKVTGRQQPRRWAADMDFRVDLSTDTSVPRNGTSSSHSASDEICYASVDKSVGSKVSEAAEHCSHTASSRSESSSSSRGSDRGGDGSAGSCNGVPAPAPPDVGVIAKAKGAPGDMALHGTSLFIDPHTEFSFAAMARGVTSALATPDSKRTGEQVQEGSPDSTGPAVARSNDCVSSSSPQGGREGAVDFAEQLRCLRLRRSGSSSTVGSTKTRVYERSQMWAEQRESRLQHLRDMYQTFGDGSKPTAPGARRESPRRHSLNGPCPSDGPVSLYQRGEAWLKTKRIKEQERRDEALKREVKECTFRPGTSSASPARVPSTVTEDRARRLFERHTTWRQKLDEDAENQRKERRKAAERELRTIQKAAGPSGVRPRLRAASAGGRGYGDQLCRGGSEAGRKSNVTANPDVAFAKFYERNCEWQRARDERVGRMLDEDFARQVRPDETVGKSRSRSASVGRRGDSTPRRAGSEAPKETGTPAKCGMTTSPDSLASVPRKTLGSAAFRVSASAPSIRPVRVPRAIADEGGTLGEERDEISSHLQALRRCLVSSQGRGSTPGWQRALRVDAAKLQGAGAAPLDRGVVESPNSLAAVVQRCPQSSAVACGALHSSGSPARLRRGSRSASQPTLQSGHASPRQCLVSSGNPATPSSCAAPLGVSGARSSGSCSARGRTPATGPGLSTPPASSRRATGEPSEHSDESSHLHARRQRSPSPMASRDSVGREAAEAACILSGGTSSPCLAANARKRAIASPRVFEQQSSRPSDGDPCAGPYTFETS